MPKLEGIEEKTMHGYKVDKENDEAIFNDEKHLYINKNDGKQYVSVTTLIHNYQEAFDEVKWGRYKALESFLDADEFERIKLALQAGKKVTPELLAAYKISNSDFEAKYNEIIQAWHENRDEACAHGTEVHSILEQSFYGNTHFDLNKYGFTNMNGDYDCKWNYWDFDLENAIYPELMISLISKDGELRLSGTIDLLIKRGNEISLIDWKTNREIKKHGFYDSVTKKNKMLKFPVNNLQDCNFNVYQLQLSTYAYMLQVMHPEFVIKSLKIVHIDRSGKQKVHECEYLKDDVIRMLNHYKKQKKIQEQLDKNKPYVIG